MGQYVAIRNGGKTDENAALRFLRRASANGQGPVQSSDIAVSQHSAPNKSVDIAVGDLVISYQDYCFYTWIDAIYNLAIAANVSGNDRIDCVVAYVDLSVVSSVSNNNPGALKFMDVQGTPALSPIAPNGTAIQAAVGAGNPYYILANVLCANGYGNIVNANVTDERTQYLLGGGTKYAFVVSGAPSIASDVSAFNPTVPSSQSVTTLCIHAKTAPTGAGCSIQIYNINQAKIVGTVTLSAASTDASATPMTNGNLSAGDVLRVDCTAQGSIILAADLSIILF